MAKKENKTKKVKAKEKHPSRIKQWIVKNSFEEKTVLAKRVEHFVVILSLLIVSLIVCVQMVYLLAGAATLDLTIRGIVAGFVTTFLCTIMYFYISVFTDRMYKRRDLLLLYSIIYPTIIICVLFQKYINPYAIPIIAATLNIGILIKRTVGIMSSLLIGVIMIVVGFAANLASREMVEIIISNLIGILTGSSMIFLTVKNETRFRLLWGTILISAAMVPVSALIGLIITREVVDVFRISMFGLVGNILGIAIFTASMPIAESLFGVWTNYKLAEYSSFDQPLLRKLAKQAPGTFHHSLSVGNLAELCALEIGENPYQARIAGYYHDIGKMNNPNYFVENQTDGYNPHNELIPEMSVQIISKHTRDGYLMLKEAGLPEEIAKIALEHHGTSKTTYFYNKAQNITEGELDSTPYRYKGPLPTSKLAAIVTICDIVEATVRSRSMTQEEIKDYIQEVINSKISDGQFINCNITLRELNIIGETICKAVPSIRHQRIDYKQKEKRR